MPAIQRFKVTQEREVEVHATSPEDAVAVAKDVFCDGPVSDRDLYIGPLKIISVRAEEAY